MESLKNKEGKAFDTAYLQEMIKHHQHGIEMMNMAIEKAESEGVRDMSEKMGEAQAREIEKMHKMLDDISQ